MIKAAAIQMCSSHVLSDNLRNAARFIQEASDNGAKLIVLPETFAFMGLTPFDKMRAEEIDEIQAFLSEQAHTHKTWIVGGTVPLTSSPDNKAWAASLVYDDTGNIAARYDKIHLFDVEISSTEKYKESETIEPGNKIVVVQTPIGKLGLAVCYDIRFPELFRCLVNKGAEVIAIPAAFTVKTGQAHWELLVRSRAVENLCYIIGACQGGTHSNGRQTYGNSLIVEPWGSIVAHKADDKTGIIYSNIDLDYQKEIRKSLPVLEHQKIFSTVLK